MRSMPPSTGRPRQASVWVQSRLPIPSTRSPLLTPGGSFNAPLFTVAWPTGEFGGMGLEGAVKLGYRKELAALQYPDERTALYEQMVARMYEHGKAVNTASTFELDDVIDPLDSRRWIVTALRSVPEPNRSGGKKRPCIDTW